jgi:hypothetical protein
MFDEPTSLPMRAAIASLLGSCFGIALIVFTHSAQAQAATAPLGPRGTATAAIDQHLLRLGEAALRSLCWQVARMPGLRSEGDIPRSRDLVSVGVQVRF